MIFLHPSGRAYLGINLAECDSVAGIRLAEGFATYTSEPEVIKLCFRKPFRLREIRQAVLRLFFAGRYF